MPYDKEVMVAEPITPYKNEGMVTGSPELWSQEFPHS